MWGAHTRNFHASRHIRKICVILEFQYFILPDPPEIYGNLAGFFVPNP